MICEYALEPELVATWHQRELFRYFIERFGFRDEDGGATGRVVAQYPSKWRRQVWEAFETNFGQSAREDERERVTELLKQLTIPEVRRSNTEFDKQCTWLENAEKENTRHPFHAILACNPSDNPQVVYGEDVLLGMNPPPLWSVSREIPVQRTAASMATHLKPMLRCATQILFVDPHFRPSEPRFRNPLEQFLKIICDGSRDVILEYHTMHNDKKPTWNCFLNECQRYLPSLIPHGFTLTVRRWEERSIGQELHDRYILTDIGGVKIPRGLDEDTRYNLDESERGTIDVSRLSYETWQQRLEDYGYDSGPAFDLEGKVTISVDLAGEVTISVV